MRPLESQKKYSFKGPDEFSSWIKKFAENLGLRELLLINGDLGAGKTFFVTELLKYLGGKSGASPSFAIHNQYQLKNGIMDHVDLYRLKNNDDLESTGFWDLFAADKGVIAVEWANKLKREDFPETWPTWEIEIKKSAAGEKARDIEVCFWLGR